MVRSCPTSDDVNKDYVCTQTTSPGINFPPHLDHLAYAQSFWATQHGLREIGLFLRARAAENVSFVYDGRAGLGPLDAKRHRWKRTAWSDGTGRRSDSTNETIRASAEKDVEQWSRIKGRS